LLTLLVALSEPWEILRSVAAFAAGVAVAAGLFLLWLVLFSDPHLFLRHAIEVPMQLGRGRLPTRDLRYLPFFLQAATTTGWCYAVALGAAIQGVVLLCVDRDFRRVFMATPTDRLALGLSLLIPFVQRLFEVTTLNQRENVIFLSGVALAMGTGLFCRLPAPSERHRLWIPLLACIIGGYLLFEMMEGSRNRIVHDVFPSGARTLFRGLRTPQLASIWWIQPTRPGRRGGPDLKPGEIDAVCKYLSSQQQDFFVLGDSSFLYGVMGVVPPQPLLYLSRNHFFTDSDIPFINDWVLSSLKKRNIRIVVREKDSWSESLSDNYAQLPKVMAWIKNNFHPGPVFGNFEILLR
jgi:hypothetical protein